MNGVSLRRHASSSGLSTYSQREQAYINHDSDTLLKETRDHWMKEISLFQIDVKLSMKFTSREFSLKRMPSRKQSGVFGVKINVVTK